MKNKKIRVIDFFCGAGGFSEGFRQQGFDVIMGVDNWQPAIDTHNLNHGLKDTTKNVLDFWGKSSGDVSEINKLPPAEVLIGSPSCVSFSMSNKAGKADKTHGIRLIEAYLRVVAVKKHEADSTLKAWYMENVPQSRTHVKIKYSFKDLNLGKWSLTIGKKPDDIAVTTNGGFFNSKDFGAPQGRERFVAGEWVKTNEFLRPESAKKINIKLQEIKKNIPKPNDKNKKNKWTDPNYPSITLEAEKISDHFYDSGIYKLEWEKAEYLKTNHPFMGKMSFPENEDRPSRTILATKSASSREALIYKSEYNRKGDGEYRAPTIREIACLMGFPYVYQFVGSEGIKWKQVGNAVCPHMGNSLAKTIRKKMGLGEISHDKIDFSELSENYKKVNNLNTFTENKFDNPRKRNKNALFRRHPLKLGNMTVDLMNYHPDRKDESIAKSWHVGVFFGTGDDHKVKILDEKSLPIIEKILDENLSCSNEYKKSIKNIATKKDLQKAYEDDLFLSNKNNPVLIVKGMADSINLYDNYFKYIETNGFFPKETVPLAQIMAMYGLLKLVY
ncbi:MAG: DNA cytosine methyltransferase [Candidatus Moraniibacteriota bacterium]|nr:MAG: DNA cytosine methyltransferase [Candidatus Moranbacteria bacterium]